MKSKKITAALILVLSLNLVYGQKSIEKLSEYTASNGITYRIGDDIKLGRGTGMHGNFKFVNNAGTGYITKHENHQLGASFASVIMTIKKIKRHNTKKQKGIIFSVSGIEVWNCALDIENAIASCEIEACKSQSAIVETEKPENTSNKNYEKMEEYLASNGEVYKIGSRLKLNEGSAQNGNFIFITESSNDVMNFNPGAQLKAKYEGTEIVIKQIKKYNLKRLDGTYFTIDIEGKMKNFIIDIENAIATCEVEKCNEKVQKVEISEHIPDKYDKLKKLKTLLDEGILTQEEFDAEKKKILEQDE